MKALQDFCASRALVAGAESTLGRCRRSNMGVAVMGWDGGKSNAISVYIWRKQLRNDDDMNNQ